MSKIVAAIAKIMGEVGSVKKEGENKFHNYKYATASDILHKLQPLLAREKLVIFQNECGRELVADGLALAITYEFSIAHAEGDTWADKPKHTGMAAARNTKGGFDDKAANKCHTAARKYFLLALFQIPTGDYDDADEQEDRPPTKPITAAQVKQLSDLADEVGADKAKFCRYLNVASLAEIPAGKFKQAIDALEAKRPVQAEAAE